MSYDNLSPADVGSICSRQGACIPSAYEDFINKFKKESQAGEAMLVHGWAYSPQLGRKIKHAWVEVYGEVWEPVTQQFLGRQEKALLKLQPVKRYDRMQILKRTLKTNSRGGQFEF